MIRIVTMDKLYAERHRERELLYNAVDELVRLPRQGVIGLKDKIRIWRLADALQYVPGLERALGAAEERNRFLERRIADLVRQFVNLPHLRYFQTFLIVCLFVNH